ncbi:hypothetical protein O1611_g2618 [Lasiodiplodia mahajangana]|uniref:Uncharacterized protein n=1 Tax=Lasiodiplodia mahajangana TaxID=1108764 RepID=A0ACC2JUJ8_9PEZI|nr:hypothetical protein O1611_g2618 [Lasiodiplodia mahajangana]
MTHGTNNLDQSSEPAYGPGKLANETIPRNLSHAADITTSAAPLGAIRSSQACLAAMPLILPPGHNIHPFYLHHPGPAGSNMASADNNELGSQSGHKSPSKATRAQSIEMSTPCFLHSAWDLLPVDGKSSEKTPLLGMFLSHFVGAFIQLELLGPESSLSARFEDYERLSNDQFQRGTVFLRRSHIMAVGNSSNITEIRISWEKGRPDKDSKLDSLKVSDGRSYFDNVEDYPYFSGSDQLYTLCYKVTLESYNSYENDSSRLIHHKTATKVYGDLYHRSVGTEPVAHWTICSAQSGSRGRRRKAVPKSCIDVPMSYNYGLSAGGKLVSVAIGIDMCTAAIIQFALQDIDHNIPQDSVDCEATQFDFETKMSISHQRLCLKAECRLIIKGEGTINHEGTFNQARGPHRIKADMNVRETSPDLENLGPTQSPSKSKPVKRGKEVEELKSKQAKRQTTPSGISTKRRRLPEDTGGLACPFYKMNPWKFDHCLSYKLSKMSYVKQHLLRYHDAPQCSCSTCQKALNKEAGRDSSTRSNDCQQSQYTLYVMTAEQKRDIRHAAGRKITCEDKWYQIWSILFPGVKKPDSPFVKGHYFAEVLSSVQAFYHDSRSHIVEETFREVINNGDSYHEAFDKLLKKVEYEAVTQCSQLDSSFCFRRSIETEGTDCPVARRSSVQSLSTDSKEAFSFPSITGDHNPIPISSPSTVIDHRLDDLFPAHSYGMLPCNNVPQDVPFICNATEPDISQFQMDQPMEYPERWLFSSESEYISNHNDNSIDLLQTGAVFEFPLSAGSDTDAEVGTEIATWAGN